jgi:hypothetical protein
MLVRASARERRRVCDVHRSRDFVQERTCRRLHGCCALCSCQPAATGQVHRLPCNPSIRSWFEQDISCACLLGGVCGHSPLPRALLLRCVQPTSRPSVQARPSGLMSRPSHVFALSRSQSSRVPPHPAPAHHSHPRPPRVCGARIGAPREASTRPPRRRRGGAPASRGLEPLEGILAEGVVCGGVERRPEEVAR